jgi:hypothetical protein
VELGRWFVCCIDTVTLFLAAIGASFRFLSSLCA